MLLLIVYIILIGLVMTGFNKFAPIDPPYKGIALWLGAVGTFVFVLFCCGVFAGHLHWPTPPALGR